MAHGRLRPGRPAQIVDVSPGGALIETEWRMLPGMHVELQLGAPVPLYKMKGQFFDATWRRSTAAHPVRGALAFEGTWRSGGESGSTG
jgi:hypothetical protein